MAAIALENFKLGRTPGHFPRFMWQSRLFDDLDRPLLRFPDVKIISIIK